jgi:hypothetical protein
MKIEFLARAAAVLMMLGANATAQAQHVPPVIPVVEDDPLVVDPKSDWRWQGRPISQAQRKVFIDLARNVVRGARDGDLRFFRKIASESHLDDKGRLLYPRDIIGSNSGSMRTIFGREKVYARFSQIELDDGHESTPKGSRHMLVTFVPERYRADYEAVAGLSQDDPAYRQFLARGGQCKVLTCRFQRLDGRFQSTDDSCFRGQVGWYEGAQDRECDRLAPPPADLPPIVRSKTAAELALAFPFAVRSGDQRVLNALAGTYRPSPFNKDSQGLSLSLRRTPARFFGRPLKMIAVVHDWNPDWSYESYADDCGDGEPMTDHYFSYDRVIVVLYATQEAAQAMKSSPIAKLHALAEWGDDDRAITFDAWQKKFQEGRDYYLQAFELVDGVWRVRELGELQLEFLTLKPTTIDMHEPRNSRVDGTAPLSFDLSGAP